jgi:hypothetical protein
VKLVVQFFDDNGNMVGKDECPYPPGATQVKVGISEPETLRLSVEGGTALTVPAEWSAEQRNHMIGPADEAIVFGGDERELIPGEQRPLFPLMSTCACARPITRERSDAGWVHCG